MASVTFRGYVDFPTTLGIFRVPYAYADFDITAFNGTADIYGSFEGSLLSAVTSVNAPMGSSDFGNKVVVPFTFINNPEYEIAANPYGNLTTARTLYKSTNSDRFNCANLTGSQVLPYPVLLVDVNGQKSFVGSYLSTTGYYADAFNNYVSAVAPDGYPGNTFGYIVCDDAYFSSTIRDRWYHSAIIQSRIDAQYDLLHDVEPLYDPYSGGGVSGSGGGTGNFDGTGDDVEIPSLPTLSAVDAGFITLFNPTIGQLSALASYMWSNPLFDIEAWKKIFTDPMQAILGLSIVPVAVPDGGIKQVTVGNIPTGVSMNTAATQYVEIDCGTLNVNEFWGAYLDYDPYTKAEIYLPYIGTHPLAVDDIMGKSVHVVYHVDILSGACCAYVKCGGSVLYSFIGQCASSIPITGDNWTNVINGAISIAGAIGTMVATGGATAPMAAGAIASTAVNSFKPSVEKSGAMGGTGGMLGVQTPYLILTRPRQALPARQNEFIGYPSFITMTLSEISGYTEIESIHLERVPATENELSEIESLLKSGVIF